MCVGVRVCVCVWVLERVGVPVRVCGVWARVCRCVCLHECVGSVCVCGWECVCVRVRVGVGVRGFMRVCVWVGGGVWVLSLGDLFPKDRKICEKDRKICENRKIERSVPKRKKIERSVKIERKKIERSVKIERSKDLFPKDCSLIALKLSSTLSPTSQHTGSN